MTSFGATLVFAWAAVHTYVGLYYLALFLRRPTDVEHLAHTFLSGGLAVYCIGGGLLLDANSVAEAAIALRVCLAGGSVALGGYVSFACRLLPAVCPRIPRAATGWAIFGVATAASGLGFDVSETTHDGSQPALAPVGMLWVVGSISLAILLTVHVVRAAREDRSLGVLLAATVLGALAYLGEAAPQLTGHALPGLFFHVSIVIVAILGQLLLTRFSETDIELEKRTLELEQSYAELTHAQNELVRREQLAAVGPLSAVIAHEIRNPLAILRNAASGLRRPKLAPKDRATLLEILNEETAGLTRLVSDLSTYAQPVVTARATVDLEELVREAVVSTLGDPASRPIEVRVEVDPQISMIDGDPVLLGRALANVLDNAAQAMSAGGALTVEVRRGGDDGEGVEVVVTDTGEGMDEELRKKALDPFFTTRARGTGLGLAIVDRVVRAHGGRIALESAPGEGTTVRVALPAHPPSRLSAPES